MILDKVEQIRPVFPFFMKTEITEKVVFADIAARHVYDVNGNRIHEDLEEQVISLFLNRKQPDVGVDVKKALEALEQAKNIDQSRWRK